MRHNTPSNLSTRSIPLLLLAGLLAIGVGGTVSAQPLHVDISEQEGGLYLEWTPPPGQARWVVLRSLDPKMLTPDTLAYTSQPYFFDPNGLSQPGEHWFYRVLPWLPGPVPNNPVGIEDFEDGFIELSSYPDQDQDPNDFGIYDEGAFGSTYSLRLYGNTWKVQEIDTMETDESTVWAVDLKSLEISRWQMIGFGDGEDWMFYLVWGQESANTDPIITTYTGWFPTEEWVTVHMPIGEDWHGRFGTYPEITEVYYVNDADDGMNGEWLIDNLRDASDAVALAPGAGFSWEVVPPAREDSITYRFYNLSRDDDSNELNYLWSFGDGTVSTAENPIHTYPRGGRWPVSLRVKDDQYNWDLASEAIVDSPLTLQSDFTMSFVGDVMLGRGYLNNGGYIDTYGVDYIFDDVQETISAADLALCNLENPATWATTEHPTKTIWFKMRPEDVVGVANAGFDYATLANNHLMDYMIQGMHETQNALDYNGILYSGIGDNDVEARMPLYLSYGGKSVAVLASCNRDGHYNWANPQPFLDAGRDRPGFALWNRTYIETQVPQAAENADIVLAYVHCGSEYSRIPKDGDKQGAYFVDEVGQDDDLVVFELLPDSGEVALRHYAIDQGADMVVAHHPHVIQGCEIYNGKLIAHSLGNFVMDLQYNETMPTMILETHVGDTVDAAIVRPAWIEEWIPKMASGEFANNLLDYLTYYSRLLNTHLVRLPGDQAPIAHVMWDTTYARDEEQHSTSVEIHDVVGQYRSRPIKMEGDGYTSRVEVEDLGGTVMVRYGRDILLWGNMEDEGAQPWNLNSNYEDYDDTFSHSGERSIRLGVPSNAGDNYVTLFERRVRIYPEGEQHSFLGWIATENANDAEFQVRFYEDRGDGYANQEEIPVSLDGDNDWTVAWEDFDVLFDTRRYLNIRLSVYPPNSGVAEAWFDDMAFIWWEPWQEVDGDGGVDLPYPSGHRYVQIRSTEDADSPTLYWTNEWPADNNMWSGVHHNQAQGMR